MSWNNSHTFYNLSKDLRSSRSRHRLCCRTATFTHFWSSTIYTTFHYIHYISQRTNAENCFRVTGLQRQEQTISPSKSITECIKFTKKDEFRTDFWQLDDIFEPPGRNELIVWKTDSRFFFCRLTRPTGVWGSRVRLLRHALPISWLILRKKPTVLQSTNTSKVQVEYFTKN